MFIVVRLGYGATVCRGKRVRPETVEGGPAEHVEEGREDLELLPRGTLRSRARHEHRPSPRSARLSPREPQRSL